MRISDWSSDVCSSDLTPSVGDVAEVHAFIRGRLAKLLGTEGAQVRILYGGSVKAENAAELLAIEDVDGALVGGADRKSVVEGKSVSVRVDLGRSHLNKNKTQHTKTSNTQINNTK